MSRFLQERLWSLRSFGRFPVLHRAARMLFDFYYRDSVIRRVPFGPLAGMKWYCAKGVQFWMPLGLYEQETAAWIQSHLRPGDVFFDVGANHGYFTLLGSKVVGISGQVVAFEPIPECAFAIAQHCQLNDISNVDVREMAASEAVGEAEFEIEKESANSHLHALEMNHARSKGKRQIRVSITSLDEFIRSNGMRPDVVKIDVEGAELMVLKGALSLLKEAQVRLLISTHSNDLKTRCSELISLYRYNVMELPSFTHELSCIPVRVPQ